jgi:hypothetical protein
MDRSDSRGAQPRFISPTRGSSRRGAGANLQSVGGRHLVYEEMQQHKQRMKSVRSIVDLSPPWSHAPAERPPSAAARRLRQSVASQRPPSAASRRTAANSRPGSSAGHGPSAAGRPPTPATAGSFDVAALGDEDRDAYAAMLRLLTRLPNADARAALQQLYHESEDRKLLASYTGVFPKLDNEREAA